MKNITILLVLIFTFLFSTTSWGEWSYVVKGSIGHKSYYDKDRVRKSGKYIYFWELMEYFKPKDEIRSVTSYVQLDCSIFRFKVLKNISYKKSMGEGEILLEWTPKDEWGYPLPDSVSEFTYNKVCEEHQENYVSLEVKKSGVLYVGQRNGKLGFYKEKWEGVETEENIDNIKYEGEIKNGSPNGQGTLTWSNGTKYEGEVKEGFRNGQGTSTWKDGRKYEGEYKDGLPNGQGTLTLTDGTKYDGEWKDGKETGQGTLTFPDGEKYVGEWKDENPWNGTQYDKDGNILGKKVNGKWIKQ